MRLQYIRIDHAASCGGLLDKVELRVSSKRDSLVLTPLCFVGRNGTGKSQLLQLLAEIFQAAWHQYAPAEERETSNHEALFEIQYYASSPSEDRLVKLSRSRSEATKKVDVIEMAELHDDGWRVISPDSERFGANLPSLVVGYTSGDNETLSLPFFVSRGGYAEDVREAALPNRERKSKPRKVADNRLLLIDYSTHLEVLVANLLLSDLDARNAIISHANLDDLASFRIIVQLNHSAAPRPPKGGSPRRKGIQLTEELETYISSLSRSATCWHYDEKHEIYTFDFIADVACRASFAHFFKSSIDLYKALHKLSLLNDLAIPKAARDRLRKEIETRRFASRLPEPQDEDKVFRFEQVRFTRRDKSAAHQVLDYVSLSDGEHQFAEILGVFAMIRDDNVLFILDEPESHFNPQWRIKFTKMLLDLPIADRGKQEVLLTTHAPFVPCDLPRTQVFIFSKESDGHLGIDSPEVETFGATFDRILETCFSVRPPISQIARDEINTLLSSGSAEEIKAALERLGPSVEKSFLADRARQLGR